MKYVILWFRIFFATHLLYSAGRHYYTEWQAQLNGTGSFIQNLVIPGAGGRFVNSLVEMGLYDIVKFIELVVGFCLLFNLFVPLMLMVELPISFIIFYLNFIIVGTGNQLFTGPQEIILNGLLMVFYFGYYKSMLVPIAKPQPMWTFFK